MSPEKFPFKLCAQDSPNYHKSPALLSKANLRCTCVFPIKSGQASSTFSSNGGYFPGAVRE